MTHFQDSLETSLRCHCASYSLSFLLLLTFIFGLIYSLFILCIFAQCYCIDLWSVQSFYFLIDDVHSVAWLLPVRGRAESKLSHVPRVISHDWLFFITPKKTKTKHKQQQRTIKNVRNVPCEELTCHAIINTRHLKSPFSFYTCEIILARTKCTCAQINSRGTGSTFGINRFLISDCLQSMCTVKTNEFFLLVYCTQRLFFYSCAELPPSKIVNAFLYDRWYAGPARLTWVCFIP